MKRFAVLPLSISIAVFTGAGQASAQTRRTNRKAANKQSNGRIEQVFAFYNQMPTGVTVSQSGRIFVNYPRWEDSVEFTVAEIKDGREIPFPNANINRLNLQKPGETFVSAQSVVVDPKDRLWICGHGLTACFTSVSDIFIINCVTPNLRKRA